MSNLLRQAIKKASTPHTGSGQESGNVQDNKKEVHANPSINVPIHWGPTGAIQQSEGTHILAFERENKSTFSTPRPTFFSSYA